ncbi:MAG: hypothetical protein QXD62_03195 [Candidatus Woesearchaeota archaeon]
MPFNLITKSEIDSLKEKIKQSFSNIKTELDEHLDAINQNINEIQHLYEIISSIELKLDKIEEKIESLESEKSEKYEQYTFSNDEKKIFQTIYFLSETEDNVYLSHLIMHLSWDVLIIESLINSLIAKGIPIEKKIVNGELCYSIPKSIREKHAKTNILNINFEKINEL